jgi:hypothetical protein
LIAAAAFCVIVVWGGLLLLRGAVNGHMIVRRTGRRGPLA